MGDKCYIEMNNWYCSGFWFIDTNLWSIMLYIYIYNTCFKYYFYKFLECNISLINTDYSYSSIKVITFFSFPDYRYITH